jgi:hypothetical protein
VRDGHCGANLLLAGLSFPYSRDEPKHVGRRRAELTGYGRGWCAGRQGLVGDDDLAGSDVGMRGADLARFRKLAIATAAHARGALPPGGGADDFY